MIIVKIWGGLGNQLFQYSFGRYAALQMGTEVKYHIQTTNALNNFTQRDFALSPFNMGISEANSEEITEYKRFHTEPLARFERKLAQLFPTLFRDYYVETNTPMNAVPLRLRDNCYYDGYWQSYKYLLGIDHFLRKEMLLNQTLGQGAAVLLQQIKSTHSVGVHVRRADYLQHPAMLTCDMQYYEMAMSKFSSAENNIRFFIFSDDIEWCRKNFTGSAFVLAEGNKNYEDLYLMACCKHNIIANSTFSWWGGWLNNNPEKKIIMPANWLRNGKTSEGLLVPGWITIDNAVR